MKKVWFDLTNSPHVQMFLPFIKKFKEDGFEVVITARNLAQTIPMLEKSGFPFTEIGGHGGTSKLAKGIELGTRMHKLFLFALKEKPNMCITKGPYAAFPCKLLGIPCIMFTDDDKVKFANSVSFPFAKRVYAPVCLKGKDLPGKVSYYEGIEEQLYIEFFKPNPAVKKLIKKGMKAILMRPEAYYAHYYVGKQLNVLFPVIRRLLKTKTYQVILITRDEKQKAEYLKEFGSSISIPQLPIDTLSLTYYSYAMVGAGGKMTREAAALGKKVISTYKGDLTAPHAWLIKKGYMPQVEEPLAILKELRNQKTNHLPPSHNAERIYTEIKNMLL